MTYYSQLSDFEINNLVAIAIGAKVTDSYRVGDVRESVYYSLGEDEFCVRRGYGSISMRFDPCNNPADAWPIITEHRIGIIPAPESGKWKAAHREVGEDDTPQHFTQSENPLRAAMIVFLKMQEKSK